MNNASKLINDAKQYARETIHETWPAARETGSPTAAMYELDAICIDVETCPICSVSTMHDPDADTFALVENARPATPPKEEAAQLPAFHFDSPIDWDKLAESHAIAYLRGDLATSSPESYTIEEMKVISDGMFASTAEVDAAMRADFQSLPEYALKCLLEMLAASNAETREWWESILL